MTDAFVGSDPYSQWDAAYVLGSLSSTQRREYETHLAGCAACREAVGELSGMPALLGMLNGEEEPEPPALRPQVLEALLDRVRRRRRRLRLLWIASAAAAALLAVGLLIAVRPTTAAPGLTMTPVAPSSLSATVALSPRDWGTEVTMECTYREEQGGAGADTGDRLAMVAVGRDGKRVQLATWTAVQGQTATPTASTSLPRNEISAVQVVSADTGEVLLQRTL